jgi:hypothetical protein
MEEHKLARLVEQFTSMRRAAMASAFNVSGTGSNAQNASKAAAIAATLGEEVPDAATLQAARKAAAASAAKTYDVPNIELPIDAAMDEVLVCIAAAVLGMWSMFRHFDVTGRTHSNGSQQSRLHLQCAGSFST